MVILSHSSFRLTLDFGAGVGSAPNGPVRPRRGGGEGGDMCCLWTGGRPPTVGPVLESAGAPS